MKTLLSQERTFTDVMTHILHHESPYSETLFWKHFEIAASLFDIQLSLSVHLCSMELQRIETPNLEECNDFDTLIHFFQSIVISTVCPK